jgi:hypothetical protein
MKILRNSLLQPCYYWQHFNEDYYCVVFYVLARDCDYLCYLTCVVHWKFVYILFSAIIGNDIVSIFPETVEFNIPLLNSNCLN